MSAFQNNNPVSCTCPFVSVKAVVALAVLPVDLRRRSSPKLWVTYLPQHPQNPPWLTLPPPLLTHKQPRQASPSFPPSTYNQTPLALGDNLFSCSASLRSPHPPTSASTVTFPQANEYFFKQHVWLFSFSLSAVLNPEFNLRTLTVPIYPVNLSLPSSLFLFLTLKHRHTHAHAHTDTQQVSKRPFV